MRLTSVALDFFASNYIPTNPKEFAGRIFVTCYMGTENSSEETRKRASNLAEEIGSHHMGEGTIPMCFPSRNNTPYQQEYFLTKCQSYPSDQSQQRLTLSLANESSKRKLFEA